MTGFDKRLGLTGEVNVHELSANWCQKKPSVANMEQKRDCIG